jgi:hypothetical protein
VGWTPDLDQLPHTPIQYSVFMGHTRIVFLNRVWCAAIRRDLVSSKSRAMRTYEGFVWNQNLAVGPWSPSMKVPHQTRPNVQVYVVKPRRCVTCKYPAGRKECFSVRRYLDHFLQLLTRTPIPLSGITERIQSADCIMHRIASAPRRPHVPLLYAHERAGQRPVAHSDLHSSAARTACDCVFREGGTLGGYGSLVRGSDSVIWTSA